VELTKGSSVPTEASAHSTVLTDLFEKALAALPLLVSDNFNDGHAYTLLFLFLKLTCCLITCKLLFNAAHLKEWLV
jgi:hypothetical protein